MITVVHLGQLHRNDDNRIYENECKTLSSDGYAIIYITSDANGTSDYSDDNPNLRRVVYKYRVLSDNKNFFISFFIKILNRIIRFFLPVLYAVKEKPSIIHIHEFGLLYTVLFLKLLLPSVKIIYDVHEDYSKQRSFQYIDRSEALCRMIEKSTLNIEKFFTFFTDGIICATENILANFLFFNGFKCVVSNYPKITNRYTRFEKDAIIFYGGGISKANGLDFIIDNAEQFQAKIILAGIVDDDLKNLLSEKINECDNIEYLGYINKKNMNEMYLNCSLGVVMYRNEGNHTYACPNKLYEYMEKGIPVIVSNMPGFESIISRHNCGIVVDVDDVTKTVEDINRLLKDINLMKKMGKNGREAVRKFYSWDNEAEKLLDLYKKVLE